MSNFALSLRLLCRFSVNTVEPGDSFWSFIRVQISLWDNNGDSLPGTGNSLLREVGIQRNRSAVMGITDVAFLQGGVGSKRKMVDVLEVFLIIAKEIHFPGGIVFCFTFCM